MTSINRRAALAATGTGLATALTVALTASGEPAPASPIGEAAHEKVRRIAKDLAYALGDWNNDIGGAGSYWVAHIHPVGSATYPVSFESVTPAPPIDWSKMEQVDLYAVQRAIDEHSRAIDAYVAALNDDDDDDGGAHEAYASFERLLSVPCRTFADVEAKAHALLTVTPRGGYHFEQSDAETLLRSFLPAVEG